MARAWPERSAIATIAGWVCLAASGCVEATPTTAAASDPAVPTVAAVRIVSLAPSLTELVFAVGAGDALVGATTACDFPEAAATVPRIGAYNEPSVERVVAQAPDLVLCPQEGALLAPVERLRGAGLRVVAIEIADFDQLFAACERVGALVGRDADGAALAASLRRRYAALASMRADTQGERALLIVDHTPWFAAGPGSFGDAFLRAAGLTNVVADAISPWPQLSREALVALDPDLVIDVRMVSSSGPDPWTALPEVRAAREGRVIPLDPDLVVRPGPRLLDGLEALAEHLVAARAKAAELAPDASSPR